MKTGVSTGPWGRERSDARARVLLHCFKTGTDKHEAKERVQRYYLRNPQISMQDTRGKRQRAVSEKLVTLLFARASREPRSMAHLVQSWVPDEVSNSCFNCNVEFTFFNRKHHCRFVGSLILFSISIFSSGVVCCFYATCAAAKTSLFL